MMMQFCKAEYQLFFDSSKRLILWASALCCSMALAARNMRV